MHVTELHKLLCMFIKGSQELQMNNCKVHVKCHSKDDFRKLRHFLGHFFPWK